MSITPTGMTIYITFGWWIVPATVSVLAFGWAWRQTPKNSPSHGYALIGAATVCGFLYGAAAIVSLAAWLIWALLT